MGSLMLFGMGREELTSNKSARCRENRKARFSAQKKAQRLARRINRSQ